MNLISIIQYEMEANYQEKSMLTNLFLENKFWGWTGLFILFFTACGVLIFQFRIWNEEDEKRKNL